MKLFRLIIFIFISFHANAEDFYIGTKTLDYCDNCINSANVSKLNACSYCISYISLMHDAFVDWGVIEPKWCLTDEVTLKQLTKNMIRYINKNPDSLHNYSTYLVADSLTEGYPCN